MIYQQFLNSNEELGFEGPEKNLQIIFANSTNSLLPIPKTAWEDLLQKINCSIISSMENSKCKSFILSESSLFVFHDRIILKTCGTIPLLSSIDFVLDIGKSIDLEVAAVLYWRKNFSFPERQPYPHCSFASEKQFLDQHLKPINSNDLKCGPSSQDHWYFYYAELQNSGNFRPIFPTFEVKMHEIHPEMSKSFFNNIDHEKDTIINSARKLIPNMSIDEFFFDPCGYSMNALFKDTEQYETIHITPENQCSFVSFESTSTLVKNHNIINQCITLFKPLSFTGIEISSTPRILFNMNQHEYIENYPISMHLMNGLYITFWSYTIKESQNHPLYGVHQQRTRSIIKNTIEDEFGVSIHHLVEMMAISQ